MEFLRSKVLFVFALLTTSFPQDQKNRYAYYHQNYNFTDVIFYEGFISKSTASSTFTCAETCLGATFCTSFFYSDRDKMCQTHSTSCSDTKLTSYIGTVFYEKDKVSCPTDVGFNIVGKYCIKVAKATVTSETASQICQNNYTASLVKITSAEKQDVLEQYLNSITDVSLEVIFIQGVRLYENGVSRWVYDNGQEFCFSNWNSGEGQPSNIPEEKYVAMRKNKGWLWHDFFAPNTGSYMCEIEQFS